MFKIGDVLGDLTLVAYESRIEKSGKKNRYWFVHCNCGNEKWISCKNFYKDVEYRSCGCKGKKHGVCNAGAMPKLYRLWTHIKERCLNPKIKSYPQYGGRGIFVCPEWINDYKQFEKDMGPYPGPDYSIDRIDNDGPYSKENCRWSNVYQQANNRRSSVFINYLEQHYTLAQWEEVAGISQAALSSRLKKGETGEKLFDKSPFHKKIKKPIIKVAIGLYKKDEKFLMGLRPEGKPGAKLWEFLGGKQENNEHIFETLRREWEEEVSLKINIGKLLWNRYIYEDNLVLDIYAFEITQIFGEIIKNVHEDLKWYSLEEIKTLNVTESTFSILDTYERIHLYR